MSHPEVNGAASSPGQEQSNYQPSVRHIPIFVEGRDEPVINKNLDTSPKPQGTDKSPSFGESGNLFNRVKSFPVRSTFDSEVFQKAGAAARAASPARTIPVKVSNSTTQKVPEVSELEKPNEPPKDIPRENLIGKIEKIQQDVLSLIDEVEKFTGTSRKDKQYVYLDEMLTQNLLKLDTIDADGQEKIKQARRNAIKCINQCIAALEQKTDAAAKNAASQEGGGTSQGVRVEIEPSQK